MIRLGLSGCTRAGAGEWTSAFPHAAGLALAALRQGVQRATGGSHVMARLPLSKHDLSQPWSLLFC